MTLTHWHILGAGSIGLLWAAYLRKAGYNVTLITRQPFEQSQQLIELEANGLKETFAVEVIEATKACEIKNLLIATKTWQTESAVASVRHALAEGANLVLMQNGMGMQQWLCDEFPKQHVFAASCSEGALRTGQFSVKHTGVGHTEIGGLNHNIDLSAQLHCALSLSHNNAIQIALWQKLVVNCCINPLTAIYDCVNGALLDQPLAMQQIAQIIVECQQVADACGMGDALADAQERVMNVIRRTAKNSSSMRQDILLNRPSEIDTINGYIVLQGQIHGIATPLNLTLFNTIKGKEHAKT